MGKVNEQRIGDIVGADNVSITHETCMIYSKDVTSLPDIAYQIVSPKFDVVTQPVDVSSLQNLVWYAIDNNIPIVPRGNGTTGGIQFRQSPNPEGWTVLMIRRRACRQGGAVRFLQEEEYALASQVCQEFCTSMSLNKLLL